MRITTNGCTRIWVKNCPIETLVIFLEDEKPAIPGRRVWIISDQPSFCARWKDGQISDFATFPYMTEVEQAIKAHLSAEKDTHLDGIGARHTGGCQ